VLGLIRLILALGLIVFVFWKFIPIGIDYVDFDRLLWASLATQPLVLISLVFQSIRLGLLADLPNIQIRRPLSAVLLSQGLNLAIPGRVAEAFKATYLCAYAGVPLSVAIAAVFLERSVDIIIVALLGLIGVILLSKDGSWFAFFVAGILMLVLISIPFLENRLLLLTKLLPWARLRGFFENFLQHISDKVRGDTFYCALALGVLAWLTSFANIYIFVNIAGTKPVDFGGIILVFVATTIGGAVPALPGGFGGYEAAAGLALKPYGYSFEETLPLAIAMHLSQLLLPLLGAGLILAKERIGISVLIKQLRKVAD
jgi:uncharacterized membrane protein YbhN (UPF0104 family)